MGVVKSVHEGDDMPDVTTLVDTYIALWNEADPARRRALVEQTFAADGAYLDPLMRGEGTDGIDAMVAAAQAQFPGTRFVLHTGPDLHHDRVRFSWQLRPAAGGDALATGHDYGVLDADGRFASVTGFLEQ
jgi:hypothetical protein